MQPTVGITNTDESQTVTDSEPNRTGLPHPLLLNLSCLELTDDQIAQISADNSDLQFELTAKGELAIMPPTRYPGWDKEMELARQFANWAKEEGTGLVSGPSGGFRLPNGALFAPDVSWTLKSRIDEWLSTLEGSSSGERVGFPALCPDFVLELRSPGDTVISLDRKMEEYLENGARLGWLIDPLNRRVYIYRPGEPVEVLESPEAVSGEPVLPGFELDLREIW